MERNVSSCGLQTKVAEFSGDSFVPLLMVSTKDLKALKNILHVKSLY